VPVDRNDRDRGRVEELEITRAVADREHPRRIETGAGRMLPPVSDVLGVTFDEFVPALYMLSAVVYAERDGQILLLERAAGGALAGQWFLPGGAADPGELPEAAARRELLEESGLQIDGELELVGVYPIFVYGHDCLQISYRGRVLDGDIVISHEHVGAQWVDAADMRVLLTDEVIASIAQGDERVGDLVQQVRIDLDRYLRLVRPEEKHD
jgi:8-oxo-dGTP pyrophosphatase MutT (NUDIX family)